MERGKRIMLYLDSFTLPGADREDSYVLSCPPKLEMSCYANNAYPFKIFPQKRFSKAELEPITIFYGGNGSGKSTLLNIIAEKLELMRMSPFNKMPCLEDYLSLCSYRTVHGKKIPQGSRIITSDDIFDFLLDVRAINEGIDRRREELFREYDSYNDPTKPVFQLKSLDDYEELKRRNEARGKTKSVYTGRRVPRELCGKSNGESAFAYFTREIKENALYLLDEPENSLSPKLQRELSSFLADSVRFYGCQFIISTHSPFILSLRGAKIYDLDAVPAVPKLWTELENVREYYEFFKQYENELEKNKKD